MPALGLSLPPVAAPTLNDRDPRWGLAGAGGAAIVYATTIKNVEALYAMLARVAIASLATTRRCPTATAKTADPAS